MAGETACPTANHCIKRGGAGGFTCRSNGHSQRQSRPLRAPSPYTGRRNCLCKASTSNKRDGYYVAGTRTSLTSLDSVVYAFNPGTSPERILGGVPAPRQSVQGLRRDRFLPRSQGGDRQV